MISRGVQNIQLVSISSDAVKFPVEVLYSWCVLVIKPSGKEPGHYCRLANFSGAQNDHSVAILRWDVKLVL